MPNFLTAMWLFWTGCGQSAGRIGESDKKRETKILNFQGTLKCWGVVSLRIAFSLVVVFRI